MFAFGAALRATLAGRTLGSRRNPALSPATSDGGAIVTSLSSQPASPTPPSADPSPAEPATAETAIAETPTAETVVYVCTTCASQWENGKRTGISGGERLHDRLKARLETQDDLRDRATVRSVQCMGACSHACTIALTASGKSSYLFSDLPSDEDTLDDYADAVLECARRYDRKPGGRLPWNERPELIKNNLLGRVPPLPEDLTIAR